MSRILMLGVSTALASVNLVSIAHAADPKPKPPIDSVVVTGSPISEDPDFLTTIVDSVTRDQIVRTAGANLADALGDTPGVTGTGFASGASRPVIRGFDANRVRVLEDGLGSFDVSDVGPDHGVPIDPLSAQKIEVVRGPATLRYGSQAIGGVVNAINNRVPTTFPDQPISVDADATYGSNSATKQGAALLDGKIGDFGVHLDGFERRANDYDTPRGTLPNSFFRGDGYSAGTSYFFDDNRVGADVVHYDAKYGIPGEDTFIDMKQTKEMLRSSFGIHSGPFETLTVEGGHADYEHSERDNTTGAADSTFKDREWDARAEALIGRVGVLSGAALGVQAQQRDFQALGEGADYLLPTTTRSSAAFGFAEIPLADRVSLQTGARIERVLIDGASAADESVSRTFTPISASAGVAFDATSVVRLGITLSSAARAPAQTELFARGPHDGPGTFETGDPRLDLERANSLEGSIRVRADDVRVDASVWGAKFDNYIYGALTGRMCDDEGMCESGEGELKELNYTQVGAKFYGAEAKATKNLGQLAAVKFSGEFLADYVRAKLDDGTNVPRIPPYHLGAGLNFAANSFDGGVLVKYTGAQDDFGVAETRTAGFISVDAQVVWRPIPTNDKVEVALIGRNLTDSVQRNAVALNKDEVILPGRDFRLLVRAGF